MWNGGMCTMHERNIIRALRTVEHWTQNIETDMITLSLKFANDFFLLLFLSLSLNWLRRCSVFSSFVISVFVLQNGNNEAIKFQLNRRWNVLNAIAVCCLLNEFRWFSKWWLFLFSYQLRNVRTSASLSPTTDYECLVFRWWQMIVAI